ncbi:CPBP family intramembrane glutamic endopeptidase [Kocuria sp.]|uniref:CPBP family intramembrane glutamic endopeptidase n=1 Tax=Kocuria sp. TaxID=1871328 RepID=UPI0026DAB61B|nr:CPBP family intramembrane glutamic endopeptidase [Kocuria sp.]MDO4920018.1 CPBP family intramembrane metalloprotease [Kocuria sp.]
MTPSLEPPQSVSRADLRLQILLVLGVSLGASAVYSVLDLAEMVLRSSVAESSTTLNRSLSPVPAVDALRQLTGICFALVPVALAVYLLAGTVSRVPGVLRGIGADGRHPVHDAARGLALFAVMGGGTLALYQAGRALGITAQITTSSLENTWWSVPLLLASAARHALVEEVLVVAFLADRMRRLGHSWWTVAVCSAVFRASYHLYQGVGPALGNLVMGLVFVWCYRRGGRVMPLLIAHFLLDAVGFLAPQLL